MDLNRAEELMQKQINCAKETMEQTCFHRACSCCVNYMSQEEEQELRVISLHIMQAWKSAKNEILKTCGCRTAFDIMEKWEAKTDGNGCENIRKQNEVSWNGKRRKTDSY